MHYMIRGPQKLMPGRVRNICFANKSSPSNKGF
jgi:hypothetical protein